MTMVMVRLWFLLLPILSSSAFTSSSCGRCMKRAGVRCDLLELYTSAGTGSTAADVSPWDRATLDTFASQQGVVLSLTTLGPGFRGIARSKHNETQILGYVEGFIRPTNTILHLDKMEVFRKMVTAARKENPDEFRGGGSVFGVGMLVGYLCLLHGMEQGCSVAEFLAIDDEDYQHKRLVRYYKNAGFNVIKYVGDDWRDVPDRLVWGGCGTLLRQDMDPLLDKWTRILARAKGPKE